MIFILLHVVGFKISGAVKVEVCGQQPPSHHTAKQHTVHFSCIESLFDASSHLAGTLCVQVQCKAFSVLWAQCGIERVQLTSEQVILCSAAQCSTARHQACPSDQQQQLVPRAAVFSRELGAGAGHSTISVTNYANPLQPPPTHHQHHQSHIWTIILGNAGLHSTPQCET